MPVVAAAIVIGLLIVIGLAVGIPGFVRTIRAKRVVERAKAAHTAALDDYHVVERRVQARVQAYGARLLVVQSESLGAWVQWLQENEKRVNRIERLLVNGVSIELPDLPALKARVLGSVQLLQGGASAVASGYAAAQVALWGVTSLATASTGTAISGLTGVAATNATLAWLGGGSLAAGGGGMALGSAMLTGIATGPAVFVGGIAVGVHGQRSTTKAKRILAQSEIAIGEAALRGELLGSVEVRVDELESVLASVEQRALSGLEALRELDFDPDRHLEQFQQTALHMKALGTILETPLVDAQRSPSQESLQITELYGS